MSGQDTHAGARGGGAEGGWCFAHIWDETPILGKMILFYFYDIIYFTKKILSFWIDQFQEMILDS